MAFKFIFELMRRLHIQIKFDKIKEEMVCYFDAILHNKQ